MWPTLASTSNSGPRNSAIFRALVGDSTITSRLPFVVLLAATGSPFLTHFLTLTRRRHTGIRRFADGQGRGAAPDIGLGRTLHNAHR